MRKYKVNIIYNSNKNIDDIFIKVLLKEFQTNKKMLHSKEGKNE